MGAIFALSGRCRSTHGWGPLPALARLPHAQPPGYRPGPVGKYRQPRGRAPAADLGSKSFREQRGRAVTREVRLGIVGYGAQGSVYARMIADGQVPGMALGALADRHAQPRQGVARRDPDTLPHYDHPAVAMPALDAGLHVLVEKPAAVYTKQVRELIEAAEAKPELTFAIMFNQRTNPLYRRIKEIVDAGEIGAIRRSTWTITTWWRPQGYYEQSAWRATWGGEGGGVLVNQSPHQLDLWQWICGVPKSVFAKAGFGFRRNIAVEDEVTALADYGD